MKRTKTAIFAGLGRLGTASAEHLLEKGWQVSVSCRRGRPSERAAKELVSKFGIGKVLSFDTGLEKREQADDFIKASLDRYGKIDALINIASDYPNEKDHWQRWQNGGQITNADWQFYDTNFLVARNPILALLENLGRQENLNIINFADARSLLYINNDILDPYTDFGGLTGVSTDHVQSSEALQRLSKVAPKRHANPYTLAKIDVVHLTRLLALEYGPKVRVNAIAPGPMVPPPDTGADESDIAVQRTILKRWGGCEPIVKTIDFLIENDFFTGQILKPDGGMHLYLKFGDF